MSYTAGQLHPPTFLCHTWTPSIQTSVGRGISHSEARKFFWEIVGWNCNFDAGHSQPRLLYLPTFAALLPLPGQPRFGDLYPLQGWLDDTEMRCHCACFQSSSSGVPTPTKITFWIPFTAQSHTWISMNDKRNWCCNISSMIISVPPYEFILLSWTLHQVYSLSSYFLCSLCSSLTISNSWTAIRPRKHWHINTWCHGPNRDQQPTTNNDLEAFVRNMVHSYLWIQTNDAISSWYQLTMSFQHANPTPKRATPRSKLSPVKHQSLSSSTSTVVCSHISRFFCPTCNTTLEANYITWKLQTLLHCAFCWWGTCVSYKLGESAVETPWIAG